MAKREITPELIDHLSVDRFKSEVESLYYDDDKLANIRTEFKQLNSSVNLDLRICETILNI